MLKQWAGYVGVSFFEDLESSLSVTLPKPDYSAATPPPFSLKCIELALLLYQLQPKCSIPTIWLNSRLNRFYCKVVFSTWPISSKVINATASYASSKNLFLAVVLGCVYRVSVPHQRHSCHFLQHQLDFRITSPQHYQQSLWSQFGYDDKLFNIHEACCDQIQGRNVLLWLRISSKMQCEIKNRQWFFYRVHDWPHSVKRTEKIDPISPFTRMVAAYYTLEAGILGSLIIVRVKITSASTLLGFGCKCGILMCFNTTLYVQFSLTFYLHLRKYLFMYIFSSSQYLIVHQEV